MTLAFTEQQQGYQKICDSSGLWHLFFPAMENYMEKTEKNSNKQKRLGCLHSCLQAIALSFVH